MRYFLLFISSLLLQSVALAQRNPIERLEHETTKSHRPWAYFLKDSEWKKYKEILDKTDDEPKLTTDKIMNFYCNGQKPKFAIIRTVKFKPNIENWRPIDIKALEAEKQIAMSSYFFKNDFLYRSGGGKNLSKYLQKRTNLDKYNDNVDSEHFVSSGDYREFSYRNLELSADMFMLIDNFTFHLPQSAISEMYKSKSDDFHINKFGYVLDQFKATEAILFKDYIWRYVLIHDTQVKEAPQDDGSTAFDITWTPDLFCRYGISIQNLCN